MDLITKRNKSVINIPNWYAVEKLSLDDNKTIYQWCKSYNTYSWILIAIILLYLIILLVSIFIIGIFNDDIALNEIKKYIKYPIGFLTIIVLYMIISNLITPNMFYINENMYKIYKKVPKGNWLFLLTIIVMVIYIYFARHITYTIIYIIGGICPLILFICLEIYIRYRLKQCDNMFNNNDLNIIMIDQDGIITTNKVKKNK